MSQRLEVFELETWFRRYAFEPGMVNLSPSNPASLSVAELLELAGVDRGELMARSLDYGETTGAPELRAAIASLYDDVDPTWVIVTCGAVEAIALGLGALVRRGMSVVLETPIYGSYAPLLRVLGATVHPYRLSAADGYRYDFDRLASLVETSAAELIVVNPFNNPTGRGIDSDAALHALATVAAGHGARVLADEVFRPSDLFGGPLPSLLESVPDGVVIGDCTKPWGLGGLRIGWIAVNDEALRAEICNLRDYTTNSNAVVSEWLATVALGVRDVLSMRALEGARVALDEVERYVSSTGGALSLVRPTGGYSALVEVRDHHGLAVTERCRRLAERTGQLLLPGAVFTPELAASVRIGLAAGGPRLVRGLQALSELR